MPKAISAEKRRLTLALRQSTTSLPGGTRRHLSYAAIARIVNLKPGTVRDIVLQGSACIERAIKQARHPDEYGIQGVDTMPPQAGLHD